MANYSCKKGEHCFESVNNNMINEDSTFDGKLYSRDICYERGRNGYKIKSFLRFFNQKPFNKVFIDGKQRNNEVRDTQAVYDFEIKDNNLYIYSRTAIGRNRYIVVQKTRVEDNVLTRGRKREVETVVDAFPNLEKAKNKVKQMYAKKDILEDSKRIYSVDYELRYYRTPNDYDVIDFKSELNDLLK